MPSLYSKRGDVPTLRRLRELFRKKRDVNGDAPSIQELLQNDRGDLLRDIERILEGHKSSENLAPLNAVRTAVTYCSAASQTLLLGEVAKPASPEPDSVAATPETSSSNYMSSSTQTERQETEEITNPSISQPSVMSLLLPSCSPACNEPQLPPCGRRPLGKIAKAAENRDRPKSAIQSIPVHETKSSHTPASRPIARNSPGQFAKGAVIHRERYSIDDETGTILLWKTTMVGWRDKRIFVRLPPQSFSGHKIGNMPERIPEKPRHLPAFSDTIARDIGEMRQSLQALQDGGEWAAIDDEDETEDEIGNEYGGERKKMRKM